MKYDAKAVTAFLDSKEPIPEDGIEDAFDVSTVVAENDEIYAQFETNYETVLIGRWRYSGDCKNRILDW